MELSEFINEFLSVEELESLTYLPNFILLIMTLMFLWVAKKFFDLTHSYNLERQLVKEDNKAVALAFIGYLAGVAVILEAVFEGESQGLKTDVIDFIIWGTVGIILLNFAGWFNDKFLLRHFNNQKELIQDRNIGTGAVVAGSYLGSAILIRSVIIGESLGLMTDLLLVVGYFMLAQIFFLLFSFLYQKLVGYDMHREIEEDNIAAGISLGMNLCAIGLLLAAPLQTSYSIMLFVGWFIMGSSVMAFSRVIIDKAIIPTENIDHEIHEDRNWGVAVLEGTFSIMAVVFLVNIF